MGERSVIRDDADMLIVAVQDLSAALAPIVVEIASARARFILADEIERRDLVPRQSFGDQPSANELLVAVLRELARHASNPRSTATGAHDLARRVGVSMGVVGAKSHPAFRRTRAQVDADPNPGRRREGRARASAVRRAEEGSERW